MNPSRGVYLGMALAGAAGVAIGVLGMRTLSGDRVAVEATVRDYLLAHPEILPEAMKRLEDREGARRIATHRAAIETPFAAAWAGNPKGDVTLVMFTDYSCGYCRTSAPEVARLLAEDPMLKVVWREVPILGPDSENSARAALAAAKAGRYTPFHNALFTGGRPDAAGIAAAGRAVGLDPAKLTSEGAGPDVTRELQNNVALASALGVSGTPAFIIGDRKLDGAVGREALAEAIRAARKS